MADPLDNEVAYLARHRGEESRICPHCKSDHAGAFCPHEHVAGAYRMLSVPQDVAPILSDILAELAQVEAGGGIMLPRYNTLSDYQRAVRDGVNALMHAKIVRPKAGT